MISIHLNFYNNERQKLYNINNYCIFTPQLPQNFSSAEDILVPQCGQKFTFPLKIV